MQEQCTDGSVPQPTQVVIGRLAGSVVLKGIAETVARLHLEARAILTDRVNTYMATSRLLADSRQLDERTMFARESNYRTVYWA